MSNVYTALSQALYFSANFVSSSINQDRLEKSGKASAQLFKSSPIIRMGGVFMLFAVLNPMSMKAQDSCEPIFGLNYFVEQTLTSLRSGGIRLFEQHIRFWQQEIECPILSYSLISHPFGWKSILPSAAHLPDRG